MTARRFVAAVAAAAALAAAVLAPESAQAGVRRYTVPTAIVVKVDGLPDAYKPPLREAVELLNRYVTSPIRVQRWCYEAVRCVRVAESDAHPEWSAWTYPQWWYVTYRGQTRGHWLGSEIRVSPWMRGAGRINLRGLFAHELGHAVAALPHDTTPGHCNVMGDNDPDRSYCFWFNSTQQAKLARF